MNPQAKIYLSYAKDDLEIAKQLYHDLKSAGAAPWMDAFDLLPGQNWKTTIHQAIRKSDYVMMLISSRSVRQRGFVHKEQKIALELLDEMPESEIFVIPVRIDDCEIPLCIEHIRPADIFPSYEAGFNQILRVFDTSQQNPDHKPPPTSEQPPESPTSENTSPPLDATGHNTPTWVFKVSVASALVFIVSLLAIAVFIPHPTPFQIFVFRIVLALAAAAFGATIPGFLKIRMPLPAKGLLHAGGAVGLFVLIFLVNPPELISPDQLLQPVIFQKLTGTILDQDGEPLPNVRVTLQEFGKQTLSNPQGFFAFEIDAEKQATVRIMAQKNGFAIRRQDVMLGSSGHTFKMEKEKKP